MPTRPTIGITLCTLLLGAALLELQPALERPVALGQAASQTPAAVPTTRR